MNPNIRRENESQEEFRDRRRAENNVRYGGIMFWDSMRKGTYVDKNKVRKPKNAMGQYPKLKKQPPTADAINNKFKGFRKVRGRNNLGLEVWVKL